jgi:hypothetical protein
MEMQAEIGLAQCPFLGPEMAERLGEVLVCRLPDGKSRIPSKDELARFCTGGHHYDCPLYREARHR